MAMQTVDCKDQGGRPVIFGDDLKADFLDQLAMGHSNSEACEAIGIGRSTLHLHLSRDRDFRSRYDVAKKLAVDALIDRGEELAEEALTAKNGVQVAAYKLMIDHLWRKASRIAPQRWGKRAAVSVRVSSNMDDQEAAKRLAFLEALNVTA